MTSAIASPRHSPVIVLLVIICGCGSPVEPARVPVIDVTHCVERGEQRPPDAFAVGAHSFGDAAQAAILAPVPSRLTCSLALPRRGRFHASVALTGPAGATARFRLGISDGRIYEGLAEETVASGGSRGIDIDADLSAYAGWKWSLFYRPDRVTWRVVLAADAIAGAPAAAVWALPEILTDRAAARDYAARLPTVSR